MASRSAAFLAAVVIALGSTALRASGASVETEVLAAIARLELDGNFSWQTGFPGALGGATTIDGQSENGGYTVLQLNAPGGSETVVSHGNLRVAETPYGWLSSKQRRKRRLPEALELLRTPVQELQAIVEDCAAFTASGGVITGVFGAEAAEELWQANAAVMQLLAPSEPKVFVIPGVSYGPPSGRIEITVNRGAVTGYQLHLARTVTAGCFPPRVPPAVHWVISTSIRNVGTTKVDVPASAKAALDELERSLRSGKETARGAIRRDG